MEESYLMMMMLPLSISADEKFMWSDEKRSAATDVAVNLGEP